MLFYNCTRPILLLFLKLFYQVEIINKEVLPIDREVLLVGNHSSWIDTIILSSALSKPIWFLTGDFILNVPIMNFFVKKMCIIPMTKSHGIEGIENAIKKLKGKNAVCIFPEGFLTNDGKVQRFRKGVAKIQKKSNVPIIPFYIHGAYDIWSKKQKFPLFFKKIKLVFGEEFYPTKNKDVDIANEIRDKVIQLS